MLTRREQQLQALGLTKWILRDLPTYQYSQPIQTDTKLVIVAEQQLELTHPVIVDVLLALRLKEPQVKILTTTQLQSFKHNDIQFGWYLGIKEPILSHKVVFYSPPLLLLIQQTAAKRALWQQIYQSYYDLFTDSI